VRLESFVPFDEVLPYVSNSYTWWFWNRGKGFQAGRPMLISEFGDSVATAVESSRTWLSYHLPKNKATPKAIQSKLKALLQDHAHARVKALSEKLRSMDSPELAANAIEGIHRIHTGRGSDKSNGYIPVTNIGNPGNAMSGPCPKRKKNGFRST